MENTFLKKLHLKSGGTLRVLNGPRNLSAILGIVPADVNIVEQENEPFNVLLIFAKDSGEMDEAIRKIKARLKPDTIIWIAYPKKNSGIPSDLNLMQHWEQIQVHGISPVSSVAIDDTWTGIRLKPIDRIKSSGLCNDDIAKGPYAEFIDVEGRKVSCPPDLRSAFKREPAASAFFETLSFTNKKEYVLWLLTAKQEKTRVSRLEKTIEKLIAGKKNPSEK
jgi:hypothetical protein